MRKFIKVVIIAVILVVTMHSFALAIEQKEKIKKLLINNAELLVEIAECRIAYLDMTQKFLDCKLSSINEIKELAKSPKTVVYAESEIKLITECMDNVSKLKKEKIKELNYARKVLKDAQSLP